MNEQTLIFLISLCNKPKNTKYKRSSPEQTFQPVLAFDTFNRVKLKCHACE
jgi:hypothetical protein